MLISLKLRSFFSLSANFAVLGLKTTTKIDEVKKKYYELAKVYHPDVNSGDQNSHKKFAEITKVVLARHRLTNTSSKTMITRKDITKHHPPKLK
jgi:DnaJ-class molecular chaperone